MRSLLPPPPHVNKIPLAQFYIPFPRPSTFRSTAEETVSFLLEHISQS